RPPRPTTITPSALRSNGTASENAASGGVSITTRSYVDLASSSTAPIAWLSINLAGLGGNGTPAASTSSERPAAPSTGSESTSTSCVADHNDSSPINTSDKP